MNPPVFIVGSPRSGTTWLYHLLLSAGGFAIYRAETVAYTVLDPRFGGLASRADRRRLLDAWLPSELFLRSGLDAARFFDEVLERCGSTADFLRLLMDSIARDQGAERWAECTPDHFLYLRRIKTDFPSAKIIHMVRDGRDVALSMAKQRWIRPFPWDRGGRGREIIPAAIYWEWAVTTGRGAGRGLGGDYLEVRYEALVRRPRQTLADLFGFIDHPFDFDRIERTGIGSVTAPNTSFDTEPGSASATAIGRWASAVSDEERVLIEGLIGPTLADFGYQLGTAGRPQVNRAERLNKQAYLGGFRLRHLLKARTPLGRWLVSAEVMARHPRGAITDKTIRPGEHREFIRSIVHG